MRVPSATYIVTEQHGSYAVLELPDRNDAQIIYFDPDRGYPSFSGVSEYDNFRSKDDAINRIKNHEDNVKIYNYYMIAGMFPVGNATIICFIKSVSDAGLLFKKHQVYSVDSLVYVVANKYSLTQNEQKILSIIESYPIKYGHFICHTYDLSMPLSCKPSNDCIINRYISQVFDFFTIGKICPNIIEGLFNVNTFGKYEIYQITRVICETCGPVNAVRGTNQTGGLGNQTIVELIFTNYVGESIEIQSQIILRGCTPISYVPNSVTPDLVPYSTIPVWIVRTNAVFGIPKLNIIDFNKEGGDVDRAFKESLTFVGDSLALSVKNVDWSNLKKSMPFDQALQIVAKLTDELLDKTTISSGFMDRDKIKFTVKQDSAIVVTSQDGLDRCNFGLFVVATRSVFKFINKVQLDPSYNKSILEHITTATINSGNLVSNLSADSDSFSISDILRAAKKDNRSVPFKRRKQGSDDQARLKAWAVFDGSPNKPNLPMTFPSVFERIRCVSDEPGACILSSPAARPLFEMRQAILTNSDTPIVIMLNEPCFVTEVVIRLPSFYDRRPTPSSLTIYGGPYANRIFPVISNIALSTGEQRISLSITPPEPNHYRHECIAPYLSLVRFLVFDFSSPFDKFILLGIKVFGCKTLPQILQRPQIPLSPITDKLEFWEEPSHDAFIQWEERRLCALMPLTEYLHKVTKLDPKMNPGIVLAESIFRLMPSNVEQEGIICNCGRPADYRCSLCRKYFCRHCDKPNDSQDSVSDPNNTCKLCLSCSDKRFKMTASVTKLVTLNARMANNLYPFIGKEDGKFYEKSPFVVINQLPIGKNGVSFEQMLATGKEWTPEVNYVKVDLLLKQKALFRNIIVKTKNPVDILFGNDVLHFLPPGNRSATIEAVGRVFSFVFVGNDIGITGFDFEKDDVYIKESYPKTDKNIPSCDCSTIKTRLISNSQQKLSIIMPLNEQGDFTNAVTSGIEISDMTNIKSIAIFVQDSQGGEKFFRYYIPKMSGMQRLLLPSPLEFRQLTVYYTESYGNFNLPTAKALIVNVK
ncbi:hypothetical protein TVAG_299340 [Trichomonas vaginalis G3]|uniref:Uncharacterized protein n=1 Tax=Trichomonas vaginalis (strain ATCC PRA-98 / G3) TaxID=412133 RepID=A2EVR1_TRIV3|nr:phosphatidylinositol-3-phosphate biosynthetic process [Trichomonas vaginalis G3]EAY03271.1 hypothetical protein TVAG_299340 [Trichomonas vaginalis G3]KAI5535573.1 phosphatidylinositol-3-phosphate biosynthetic process [Trichomonas vaginalis G3]|eukprot:XP_001315494.1 hypothetical protein [Trichomonas vaginalis G3]